MDEKTMVKLLDGYLMQYATAKARIKRLNRRKVEITEDMKSPLKGVALTGMPHSGKLSNGAASFTFMLSEIEDKIIEEQQHAKNTVLCIYAALEFLPENSRMREYMEMKYLDGTSISKIAKEVGKDRKTVSLYISKGLYRLISFPKIQQIIKLYSEEVSNYE